MDLSTTISPYKTIELREDVVIESGNILSSPSSINPFKEEWTEDKPFYVEYLGDYFLVSRYSENRGEGIGQSQGDGYI